MAAIDFEKSIIHWHDRALGPQTQALAHTVGDFVLLRADGCWAYQLAVVVDDAAQGITHVVRGQDLCDNTPRQIWLQALLGLPTPQYLHTPLLLDERGEKLSKQHGAPAVDTTTPEAALAALHQAAAFLGLPHERHTGFTQAFEHWIGAWKDRIRSGENPNHRAPSS